MSGEPKTLTPGELLAIAHERDWSAHFHDDGYVEIESLGGDALAYEGGLLDALCAATSRVLLGVPVVARDEAAELRAAVRELYAAIAEGARAETGFSTARFMRAEQRLKELAGLAGGEGSDG